ncbi:GTPase HflX [Algisphaera agarilytica]|uniref:GTPase HflX n=1 Tax=Algisphaera agarilytica TaxID=1385975 RepID=A0A7X0LL17_9BACT|nr:GTPase HflX [Algisphaera agarilytica]MBB6430532.1 GTP-binding protein HflX [Algisphaera agarilytica]
MESGQREKLAVASERAILVACLLPDTEVNPHDPLDELRSLAATAGAVVVDEVLQKRQKPSAKSFLGKGKVQELAERVKLHQAQVIILENDLSPSQIGNIEKVCEVKVLDRSELILDIFAARAQTHEARLQVELAQLEYTYPRLRAMWTHLERIVGGAPAGIGTRGPGEQQLEIDRRIVQRKKSILKKEIESLQARKTREVEARNTDHFTVGLVGYTNAGKSTLFNTVTDGEAYAADQLFATLSTRTREWKLGNGDTVMLSDTVGFVRNLPHHLVASFKATLEEAVHSQLLLVVLDVSDPHCQRQLRTVNEVLDSIGATEQPRLLVLNKIDKVDHNVDLLLLQKEYPDAIPLSAATGRHIDQLVEAVRGHLHGGTVTLTLNLAQADGKALTFLENRATVLERDYQNDRVHMTVKIGHRQLDQLKAMGTSAILPDEHAQTSGSGWGR